MHVFHYEFVMELSDEYLPFNKLEIYQLLVDSVRDYAIFILDPRGFITTWNIGAQRINGYLADEIIGQHFSRFYTEQDNALHLPEQELVVATHEGKWEGEGWRVRKDGSRFWANVVITSLWKGEKLVGFAKVTRDMTGQKKYQDALKEAKKTCEKLVEQRTAELQEDIALRKQVEKSLSEQAALLDLSTDAIFVTDSVGHIQYWNKGAERLYGFTQEVAQGQVAQELLSTVFPEPFERILAKVIANGYWEGQLIHTQKNGSPVSVLARWALEKDDLGNPWRILKSNTNITEQKHAQEKLRRSEEQFRLLVEGTADYAIFMLDKDGYIATWNAGAERILGYRKEEIVGTHFSRLYLPEDVERGEPHRRMREAIKNGRVEEDRWRLRKDGQRFWATGVLNTLHDEHGKLRGFVKIMRDNTKQRLAEERIYYLANHDPLTGLANRTLFSVRLNEALARAKRDNKLVAIHVLDLDRFKLINDTLGHDIGDLLLKQVSQRLLSNVRETDTVARLGGDEFVVIQTHLEKPESADVLAHKLVDQLGQPYQINNQDVQSGASIGIAIYSIDGKDPGELLKNADLALYRVKKRGRFGFVRYSPDLATEAVSRQIREEQLRTAVREKTFELYYQPQIDLETWEVVGIEALLRSHPEAQLSLSIAELIELAEETGMIIPIGEWVLHEACRQNKAWQQSGLPPFRIAVNVSTRELREQRFARTVQEALEESELAPSCLALEVPQDLLWKPPETSGSPLAELNEMGVRLSIEDFGANFSALSQFKSSPVNIVKIPHAVVRHLPGSPRCTVVASAIIDLAKRLNIQVMAEGVETEDQLAFLMDHQCSSAQGFLFSPPVPAAEVDKLLREASWGRLSKSGQ